MKYLSFSEYCVSRFGVKVYKLSVDGGFSCPNRDGTVGLGGCIFCNGGSGRFAEKGQNITQQLNSAKERAKNKKAEKYIAYFQAYTNTYAPIEKLRKMYFEAANLDYIAAISIATRPDCLPPEVLDLIEELNNFKPVFVELGLQSIHPDTAEFINRGYDLPVFDEALNALNSRGVNTVVHLILGLPNESREDMLESVKYVASSGADGIKLQMLNVLEGTPLAEIYKNGEFKLMSLSEYASLVAECVKLLPAQMVVHRLTGDGDKRILIAPQWVKDKKRVINSINKALKEE